MLINAITAVDYLEKKKNPTEEHASEQSLCAIISLCVYFKV